MSSKTINTPETTVTKSTKRGRPTVEGSKRQAVLAMRADKVAAGGTIQRGRPAGIKKLKIDPSIEVVLNVKAPKAKKVTDTVAVVDFNPELTHESLQVL
jgi:hypothetical protein